VGDGSGRAQVFAVWFESLRGVPAPRAGHAAQAHHLNPLWVPRHGVGEEPAGQREVEADERVRVLEVGVRGREEDEGADGVRLGGGQVGGDGSAVGVAEHDGAMHLQRGEKTGDDACSGRETGVDFGVALREAGAGEIERDDMLMGAERLHEWNKGLRAAHESVEQDERRRIRRRRSSFEVSQALAVQMQMALIQHGACSSS